MEHTDMRGAVTIELADRSGAIVHRQRRGNRIVLAGRQLVAQMFGGTGSPPTPGPPTNVTHVGVGTDGTAPADDQKALGMERGPRSPITAVVYEDILEGQAPDVVARRKVSLTAVFDFGQANGGPGDPPLREAALFTAAGGGVMYNRVTLDDVRKTSDFKLTVLWDVVF